MVVVMTAVIVVAPSGGGDGCGGDNDGDGGSNTDDDGSVSDDGQGNIHVFLGKRMILHV